MPKVRVNQTSFASGELSPRMRGRTDLQQYAAGVATLANMLILSQGPATRRPGSYYVGGAKSSASNQRVRLIPFVVSSLTAYVLEFGPGYVRFYRNRGRVVDGGGTPLELSTPYTMAELRDLVITQSNDVMYICHVHHQPRKISRTSSSTFTIEAVLFENGPYDTENTGDVGATGAPAATPAESGTSEPAPSGSGSGYGGDVVSSEGGSDFGGGGDTEGGAGEAEGEGEGGDGDGGEGGGGEAEG